MANDYEISRATGKCAVSGREFKEQEFYYAALFETAEGFERREYSVESWTGPPENCFCYWKGRVPTREKKPATIAIDNSILMNLFTRLEDDSSEMRQKFRFVLALLLMRKRLVRFEKALSKEGREYWQLRIVQEQSVQEVLNPHLSQQEIEGLSAQLTAILSGDVAAIAALEEEAAVPAEEPTSDGQADAGESGPTGVPMEAAAAAAVMMSGCAESESGPDSEPESPPADEPDDAADGSEASEGEPA